jgi:hypothetical protein
MQDIIRAEQESDDLLTHPRQRKRSKRKHEARREVLSDSGDKPYTSASSSDSESDSSSVTEIAPDEVRFFPLNYHLH